MWYEINYKKLSTSLLPTFLRQKMHIRWLWALLSPLEVLHETWQIMRGDNLYKLQHNGQVCYLRKVLNDEFDPELRRIYINDGLRHQRKYIYTHAEEKPKAIYTNQEVKNGETPFYLHPSSDYVETGVDFIVWVPVDLNYNKYDMRALIDFYRLASKTYKIEPYE